MKAKNNTLKTILAILIVILISLISFIGIFVKDKNKMTSYLPDYKLGMDFTGGRTFRIKVSESNNKENLTDENYEKTREILINRLAELGIKEYEVRKNSSKGEINVTIPEDDYTDTIVQEVYQGGEFKIVDTDEANVDSVLTSDDLRKIDEKIKEKNVEKYEVAISKKEEKVEKEQTEENGEETQEVAETSETTKVSYEVNIILPEGCEVTKEDLGFSKYNVLTGDSNIESTIISADKMKKIKEELSNASIKDYSIKVSEDKAYILNSSKNKIEKVADLEVKDEILLDKENIKDVQVAYARQTSGTSVVINILFDKKGTEILNDLNKIYVSKEENSNTSEENAEKSEESTSEKSKTVDLVLDGQKLLSTELGEGAEDGKLQLSIGQASTDFKTLSQYLIQASNFAVLLKTDTIPVQYELDTNLFTKSTITNDMLVKVLILGLVISGIIALYMIVKYKKQGALAVISIIGYVATVLLLVKGISNLTITITGITAIVIAVIMDIVYKIALMNVNSKNTFKQVSCRFLGIYLPVVAISVVFAFSKYLPIASFGGILFWALLAMVIYNLIITNLLLGNSDDK